MNVDNKNELIGKHDLAENFMEKQDKNSDSEMEIKI